MFSSDRNLLLNLKQRRNFTRYCRLVKPWLRDIIRKAPRQGRNGAMSWVFGREIFFHEKSHGNTEILSQKGGCRHFARIF